MHKYYINILYWILYRTRLTKRATGGKIFIDRYTSESKFSNKKTKNKNLTNYGQYICFSVLKTFLYLFLIIYIYIITKCGICKDILIEIYKPFFPSSNSINMDFLFDYYCQCTYIYNNYIFMLLSVNIMRSFYCFNDKCLPRQKNTCASLLMHVCTLLKCIAAVSIHSTHIY